MDVDIEKRVGQYVSLRDKIKELDDAHKAAMKPYRDMLDNLNGMLLSHLNDIKADSVKSGAGTVYRTVKKSASLDDPEAFMRFVIAQGQWDLLDRKANSVAVEDFIKTNNTQPPGVKFTQRMEVNVRRS